MTVFRTKQQWFLKTPSFVKAFCLPTSSYHPLLMYQPNKPGRAWHCARLFAGTQEGKTRFCSRHLPEGFRAGKQGVGVKSQVCMGSVNTLLSPSFVPGTRRKEEGHGEQGDAGEPTPGLSFPLGEALAPPPGAGSGGGDPPRPPRLPPPGHVRGALPEACAGPREAAAAAEAPRLVALHPAPPPPALGLRAVPPPQIRPPPGPRAPRPGRPRSR